MDALKLLEKRTELHRTPIAVHLGVSTPGRARGQTAFAQEDEIMDSFKDFGRYLNGNPAMLEIWTDAIDRIEQGLPLAPVQAVVMREWLTRAYSRRSALELESQRDMLSDEKYAELAALKDFIAKVKNFKEE